ncbi:acetylglutamate kinase [Wolbachia endosymbiont of Pentidionis agamae]|uniref:acetylglutamate kinase n=1 Tax=Wolbachia endosymbiont of Pentidionis agamae TaxID=3110435 RepID=UPI0038CD5082
MEKNGFSSSQFLFQQKVKVLLETLPNIQSFEGETFVIKCNGAIMLDPKLFTSFAHNVVLLKQLGINPIVIHDGEHEINKTLKMFNINSKFINDARFTDRDTIQVIEMLLCGSINKNIVQQINSLGGNAIGLCGKDGNLLKAEKAISTFKENGFGNIEKIIDVGFIGKPTEVNPDILFLIEESDFIPVIAPICGGENGETYHIDSDSMANALATAVSASKMVMFSDSREMIDITSNKKISTKDLNALINNGTIKEGNIITKLLSYIKLVEESLGIACIVDSSIPNILLDLLFCESHFILSIVNEV